MNCKEVENWILDKIDIKYRSRIENLPIEKKRIAMLAAICKEEKKEDEELIPMLKELETNNKIVYQLDKIIERIRKYNPISGIEKDLHGEVFTDFELINKILDKLNPEVWVNPNLKWGDFCNGVGNFMIVIVKRLMIGLEESIPDENKRYKHIVEEMIFVAELQIKNMFLWMVSIDPKSKLNLNLFCGNTLSNDFKYHMTNIWKVDRFDIVVGNPPYNNGSGSVSEALWIKFIKIYNNISDIILLITPKTWCNLNDQSFDKELFNIFKNKLKYVDISDFGSKYFKGVGSTFSYFLLDNNKKDYNFELKNNEGIFNLNYNEIVFIPQIFNNITLSILKKTLWSNSKKIEGQFKEICGYRKGKGKYIVENGIYKVSNTSAQYSKNQWLFTNTLQESISDKKKVIFSDSGYNKPYFNNGDIILGHHSRAFFVNDQYESKKLIDFLNSKLVKFLSLLMVPTGSCVGFERFANFIPNDYDKIILNQEEIDFIEKFVK